MESRPGRVGLARAGRTLRGCRCLALATSYAVRPLAAARVAEGTACERAGRPRRAALARRLDEQREAFGADYDARGWLFCHPDGTPLHPDTITRRFNRLVDRAGAPRIRLHDVRHTYATLALDHGEDLKVVSERLGHADITVTAQIYTHKTSGRDAAAAKRMADLIFGTAGQD